MIKNTKTLGLVIVDGVGYKNYILSDFIPEALRLFSEIIIFSGLPASTFAIDNKNVTIIELPVFKESFKTWFWRKTKEIAHMQLHKEKFPGIAYNLEKNRPKEKSRRGAVIELIFLFTSVFNSEYWIELFNRKQVKSVSQSYLKVLRTLLQNNKVDLLYFTHQRPPYLVPLVSVANQLKIRTGTFIFSWDNLASKGRMAANFDFYIVWSQLMKKELKYFYPKVSGNNIEIAGTPQFEPYVLDRYNSNRDDFLRKFDLKYSKTICYSCGDVSTSQNDPHYISTIAEFILQKKINEEVNFIVRTSPAEDGSRFQALIKTYPFIIWNKPKWFLSRGDHPEVWSQRVPTEEDLRDLRAILTYCDLGINMCSTMSLDFMLFGKPVINPVFGNRKTELYDDQKYLEYTHYNLVAKSGSVAIAKNKYELLDHINSSLRNPKSRLMEQEKMIQTQIGKPLNGTSERMAKILKDFI